MWPIYWIKISQNSSDDFTIDKSLLAFDSLKESNFGEYSCVSSNHFLKAESHLFINSKGISVVNRNFQKIISNAKNKIVNKKFDFKRIS